MDTSISTTNTAAGAAGIACVGGGPAALVLAIALARRGSGTTVFERDQPPEVTPRFNPDRSYTIDISGHGLRALRHIDACSYFDDRMFRFKGLKLIDGETEEWPLPGWTGSRGDILRALRAAIREKYHELVQFEFECRVAAVDVDTGTLTYTSQAGGAATKHFDFIGDGAGSVVRDALLAQVAGFTVETKSFPNYCTMMELDRVGAQLDKHYLHGLSVRPFCVAGAIKGDNGSDVPRWFCCVGTKEEMAFSSTDEARHFLRARCPHLLDLAK
jgi:kynurenine 3-monooxygenase